MHDCTECKQFWNEFETGSSGCKKEMEVKYQGEEVECPEFEDATEHFEE